MMGGWHGHGGGKGKNDGLPFAGIPPEVREQTNALMAKEPDFSDLELTFKHRVPDEASFGLMNFLAP